MRQVADFIQIGPFGSLLHKRDYISDGTPIVNPKNIVGGRLEPTDRKTVTGETIERLRKYSLRAGDVVLGRRGEMVKCAVVTETETGWLCGTGSLFFRFSADVFPGYVARFLRSPLAREALLKSSVGATMNNLSQKALNTLAIPLPLLAEQHRIVAKVDELLAM